MKASILLLASLFAVASAHAHGRFRFSGSINFYAPACPAPVAYCPPPEPYCPPPAPAYCDPAPSYEYTVPVCPPPPCPPRGYWRNTQVEVWVPARYVTQYDAFGCPMTCVVPGHYECRTQRVWISGAPDECVP